MMNFLPGEDKHIATFMNDVHDEMLNRFANKKENFDIIQKEVQQAQELQRLLREIQQIYNSNNSNYPITKAAIDSFLPPDIKTKMNNGLFSTLSGSGEQILEEQLTAVMAAILQTAVDKAAKKNKKYKNYTINFGDIFSGRGSFANPANVEVLQTMFEDLYQDIRQELSVAAQKKIEPIIQKETARFGNMITSKLEGKIDVGTQSYNQLISMLLVSLEGTDLGKMVALLQDATFSAKEYQRNSPELGSTNMAKIYTAVLQELGYDIETTLYSYLRVLICLGNHSQHSKTAINRAIYEMRNIYELSGFGQQYNKKDISGEAKFLILNNGGQIFVTSIKEMNYNRLEETSKRKMSTFSKVNLNSFGGKTVYSRSIAVASKRQMNIF